MPSRFIVWYFEGFHILHSLGIIHLQAQIKCICEWLDRTIKITAHIYCIQSLHAIDLNPNRNGGDHAWHLLNVKVIIVIHLIYSVFGFPFIYTPQFLINFLKRYLSGKIAEKRNKIKRKCSHSLICYSLGTKWARVQSPLVQFIPKIYLKLTIVSIRTAWHKQEFLEMILNDAYMKYVILFTMIAYLSMSLSVFVSLPHLQPLKYFERNSTRRKIVICLAHFERNVASERMSIPRSAIYLFLSISCIPVFRCE